MSKNPKFSDPNLQKIMTLTKPDVESTSEFVNARGDKMILRPVPPYLLQMASSSITLPDVPTYTVNLEGGGTETHQHDEESIKQSGPDDQIAWAEYKAEMARVQASMSETLLNIILLEGIIFLADNPARLEKRLSMMGIVLSQDPDEKELQIKRAYAISCSEDAERITSKVLGLSGINREEVETVKDSFQGKMES